MNRRTRRDDGREQQEDRVEFGNLLDAIRGAQLPPPAPPPPVALDLIDFSADIDITGEMESLTEFDDGVPVADAEPTVTSRFAEAGINDDLLPAPRHRRRWGRR